MVTSELQPAAVKYNQQPPYRWYGTGEGPEYSMERHAVARSLQPGDCDLTLCGRNVTIDLVNPNRVGRHTCAECAREWRAKTGMPQLPVQPEGQQR